MSDDRFHEIQLGTKQLVFLFMAAAVVAVVVFLAGVMVGRGVRAEKGGVGDADSAVAAFEVVPADGGAAGAPGALVGADGQAGAGGTPQGTAGVPPADDLSYYSQLEGQTAPRDTTKPRPAEPTTLEPVTSEVPAADAPPPVPPSATTSAGPAESSLESGGYSLQVAALRDRRAADVVLRRLLAKGYAAYIVDPPKGSAPAVYRVRVGSFKTRREADPVKRKLEKDQYKPLITR